MLVQVQTRIDPSESSRAQHSVRLSHNVLVHVRLAVVGCCKGAQPGHRERVSKHHLHVHPFWLFGPFSLLLLQLFDALQGRDRRNRRKMWVCSQSWHSTYSQGVYLNFNVPAEKKHSEGLKIKHVLHSFCLSEVFLRVRWLTLSSFLMSMNITHTQMKNWRPH